MNIWLVTIGEPVPVRPGLGDRLHRTGFFARFLAGRGHRVVWWTSTFDHFRKEHWFGTDRSIEDSPNLTIRLLHGCGYRRNVSPARIRDHRQIAAKFASEARRAEKPDVIVAALPTIELCWECTRYGRTQGVPVVLDMRDMWPDIFVEAVPRALRPVGRLVLAPMYRQARAACADASAIIGITDGFVAWGAQRGGRAVSYLDKGFPMGYSSVEPPSQDVREAEAWWQAHGVNPQPDCLTLCFVGTIGRQFDLATVIRAREPLGEKRARTRLVICGTGDCADAYRQMTAGDPGVIWAGWTNAAQIHVLLRRASIGLDPLPDRTDFTATINNKAIEYMSGGLPVLASPTHGVLHDLLTQRGCGLTYPTGDVDALSAILARLCDDQEVIASMGARALEMYKSDFRAESVYARLEDHLADIASVGANEGGSSAES